MQHGFSFLAEQLRAFNQPVVILDLEATGGDLMRDRITEIAFLYIHDGRVEAVQQLVHPQQEITDFIANLTGISNDLVADAPCFADVLPSLLPYLRGSVLIAHNSLFDYTLLRNECLRAGVAFASPALCSVKLSKRLYPKEFKHNLDSIAERFDLAVMGGRHRAMPDVELLAMFLERALAEHDDWFSHAQALLHPQQLPDGLSAQVRTQLEHLSDGYGGIRLTFANHEHLVRATERAFQDTVAFLHQHPQLATDLVDVTFVQTVGALHTMAEYALMADAPERKLSGRHTIVFYEERGCLKAKVAPLYEGFYSQPPDGVFLHPKMAKKALAQWATQHGICPTMLGILPHALPAHAPCPTSLVKPCSDACSQKNIALHNEMVMSARQQHGLPICDWGKSRRVLITEQGLQGNRQWLCDSGALQLADGRWYVSGDLFAVLKDKWKNHRQSILLI